MSEMIERVARAIDPFSWEEYDRAISEQWPEDVIEMAQDTTLKSMSTARTVIAAMREPTEALFRAVPPSKVDSPANARGRWGQMIWLAGLGWP